MDIKNLVIGALTGLVALFAGYALMPAKVQTVVQEKFGALAGPDIPSQYIRWGGIADYTLTQPALTAATTTPCTIQNIAATTTIEEVVLNISTATSSAATFTIASSTVTNATTSLIANTLTLSSGAQGTLVWHSGTNNATLAPNAYVSIGASGVSLGGYTYGGSCYIRVRAVI